MVRDAAENYAIGAVNSLEELFFENGAPAVLDDRVKKELYTAGD